MTVDDIALSLTVEANVAKHLVECFGSAAEVFRAGEKQLVEQAELRGDVARTLASKPFHAQAEQEMAYLAKHGYTGVASTDNDYPALLHECPDNPHVIYVDGSMEFLHRPMLAVVGTRQVTSYGVQMCDKLIDGLAELVPDLVIVSGLAFGIDVAAHRAALRSGLGTIAVMGTPLHKIYPAFHTAVAREIIDKGGALMSESHSKESTGRHSFPQRNRIVAGMAMGTLVVESPPKGGSLLTAQNALGYNRSLMAVPGRATDWGSAGCNNLIATSRAQMVCTAEDIVAELGLKGTEFSRRRIRPTATETPLTPLQTRIIELLTKHDTLGDEELMSLSGKDYQDICEASIVLECGGLVRMSGGKFTKC